MLPNVRIMDRHRKCSSYVPSFQQHLNIMRSTYEMLTSDFVELEMTFLSCVQKNPPTA